MSPSADGKDTGDPRAQTIKRARGLFHQHSTAKHPGASSNGGVGRQAPGVHCALRPQVHVAVVRNADRHAANVLPIIRGRFSGPVPSLCAPSLRP